MGRIHLCALLIMALVTQNMVRGVHHLTEVMGLWTDFSFYSVLVQAQQRALDVSALDVHHALDTVNSLVGTIGGGASSLVVALTGISLTDCALSFNGVDIPSLSCDDFLDILSTCDSLMHVRPLLRTAKKKLRMQNVPTNKPCSRKTKH